MDSPSLASPLGPPSCVLIQSNGCSSKACLHSSDGDIVWQQSWTTQQLQEYLYQKQHCTAPRERPSPGSCEVCGARSKSWGQHLQHSQTHQNSSFTSKSAVASEIPSSVNPEPLLTRGKWTRLPSLTRDVRAENDSLVLSLLNLQGDSLYAVQKQRAPSPGQCLIWLSKILRMHLPLHTGDY